MIIKKILILGFTFSLLSSGLLRAQKFQPAKVYTPEGQTRLGQVAWNPIGVLPPEFSFKSENQGLQETLGVDDLIKVEFSEEQRRFIRWKEAAYEAPRQWAELLIEGTWSLVRVETPKGNQYRVISEDRTAVFPIEESADLVAFANEAEPCREVELPGKLLNEEVMTGFLTDYLDCLGASYWQSENVQSHQRWRVAAATSLALGTLSYGDTHDHIDSRGPKLGTGYQLGLGVQYHFKKMPKLNLYLRATLQKDRYSHRLHYQPHPQFNFELNSQVFFTGLWFSPEIGLSGQLSDSDLFHVRWLAGGHWGYLRSDEIASYSRDNGLSTTQLYEAYLNGYELINTISTFRSGFHVGFEIQPASWRYAYGQLFMRGTYHHTNYRFRNEEDWGANVYKTTLGWVF